MSLLYDLAGLGWSAYFSASLESLNAGGLVPARVARAERERYLLMREGGVSHAELSGKLRHESLEPGGLPVVGDWVAARIRGGGTCADAHVAPSGRRARPGIQAQKQGVRQAAKTLL